MFNNDYCKFIIESVSERILKIGQHLMKLQARVFTVYKWTVDHTSSL